MDSILATLDGGDEDLPSTAWEGSDEWIGKMFEEYFQNFCASAASIPCVFDEDVPLSTLNLGSYHHSHLRALTINQKEWLIITFGGLESGLIHRTFIIGELKLTQTSQKLTKTQCKTS
jgi:hypothetical protein